MSGHELRVGDVVKMLRNGPADEFEVRELREETDAAGGVYVMATIGNQRRTIGAMVETSRLRFVRSGGL